MTPWTVRFSRKEYWTGLPFPPPGIQPASPALAGAIWEAHPLQIYVPKTGEIILNHKFISNLLCWELRLDVK